MFKFKNISRILIATTLTFSLLLNNSIYPTYAKSEGTEELDDEDEKKPEKKKLKDRPENMDWSIAENQENVWQIFSATDWLNGVDVNFVLGDGIAFYKDGDSFKDFVNVFETPLNATLKYFDEYEKEHGELIPYKHKSYMEYKKIVALVLYGIYIRQDCSFINNCYSFRVQSEDSIKTVIQLVADTIHSFDEYENIYCKEESSNYYLNGDYTEYLIGELGYSSTTAPNSLWEEANLMFFGYNRSYTKAHTFESLVLNIIKELTRHNGDLLPTGKGDVFEFDPYLEKDPLQYVLLDSILLRGSSSRDLFYEFINAPNFGEMMDEYYMLISGEASNSAEFTNDGSQYGWTSYYEFYNDYARKNKNKIHYFKYHNTLKNMTGYDFEARGDLIFNENPDNAHWIRPGGDTERGLGAEYFESYKAKAIMKHKINGITGEVVE